MFSHHIRCFTSLWSIVLPAVRQLMVGVFVVWLLFGEFGKAEGIAAEERNWPSPPLTVQAGAFRDAHGRQVILSGINLVDKSVASGFTAVKGPAVFGRFREWGFNCVRLGIVWAGVEPQPGKYDEAYLAQVDKAVDWAAEHGIYVILDMHQDLYSMKYSDGAAAWATLDEGKPHTTGAIWSDAYLMSAAVQTAFDNFWANKPAVDGKGLQDHYAAMWKHLAQRYASKPGVVGYDLMNEPFPGSAANEFLPLMLTEFAKVIAERTVRGPSVARGFAKDLGRRRISPQSPGERRIGQDVCPRDRCGQEGERGVRNGKACRPCTNAWPTPSARSTHGT